MNDGVDTITPCTIIDPGGQFNDTNAPRVVAGDHAQEGAQGFTRTRRRKGVPSQRKLHEKLAAEDPACPDAAGEASADDSIAERILKRRREGKRAIKIPDESPADASWSLQGETVQDKDKPVEEFSQSSDEEAQKQAFVCGACSKSCTQKDTLKTHIQNSCAAARKILPCPPSEFPAKAVKAFCGSSDDEEPTEEASPNTQTLSFCVETIDGATRWRCLECGKVYATRMGWDLHFKGAHSTEPPRFNCDYCSASFTRRSAKSRHVREKHSAAQALICDLCQKEFLRPCEFRAHVARHFETPFSPHAPVPAQTTAPDPLL
eukprot:TRINITY_DN6463_c0_g1_i1.p2 TRINITY_DN6463_c0_g1~~TRINITY_DN6463_c0_g1_i1.p2  ORF type:complete len:333 (-),score=20.88 TRINITY_DN6463_c0_g1_i1:23-979(-)